MTDNNFITIKIDLTKQMRQLTQLGKMDAVKAAIKAAALHIKGKISTYPPATIANTAANPGGRWYQRGYGPKWNTRDGVHGRKTSETLGRRWSISSTDGGMGATISNNASYVEYVHDDQKQAGFHGARGWKTARQVAEQETDEIVRFVEGFVQSEIDRFGS